MENGKMALKKDGWNLKKLNNILKKMPPQIDLIKIISV